MASTRKSLLEHGLQARRDGDVAGSRRMFLDAVREASAVADQVSLAEAFCGLAQAESDIGNREAAWHQYALAVTLYRRMGPPERLAYALRHQADMSRKLPQTLAFLLANRHPLVAVAVSAHPSHQPWSRTGLHGNPFIRAVRAEIAGADGRRWRGTCQPSVDGTTASESLE